MTEADPSNHQHEYSELCLTLRHYSALRFAILTVFFAVTGGLTAIGFEPGGVRPGGFLSIAVGTGGLLSVLVFWIFEERLIAYMRHHENRASELEKHLGYNVYSGRPKSRLPFVKTPVATRLLYVLVAVFWLLSLFVR